MVMTNILSEVGFYECIVEKRIVFLLNTQLLFKRFWSSLDFISNVPSYRLIILDNYINSGTSKDCEGHVITLSVNYSEKARTYKFLSTFLASWRPRQDIKRGR